MADTVVGHLLRPDQASPWRTRVLGAIAAARRAIEAVAEAGGLETFRTTLVGVVAQRSRGLVFHIGDGAALVFGEGEAMPELVAISAGETGEHVGETVFVTDDDWLEHVRVTPFRRASGCVLLTDGVTPFALLQGGDRPDWGFMRPVLTYLARHGGETAAKALELLLNREDAKRVSGDDKTLLWAWRATDCEWPDAPA